MDEVKINGWGLNLIELRKKALEGETAFYAYCKANFWTTFNDEAQKKCIDELWSLCKPAETIVEDTKPKSPKK